MEELPIKVQGIVYKVKKDGTLFVLCLKRSLQDGGFWHILTGTLEANESLTECLVREAKEEIGVSNVKSISKEIHRFLWEKHGVPVWVFTYAVKIDESPIILNSEHTEYKWLDLKQAIELVKFDSTKEAIETFQSSYY